MKCLICKKNKFQIIWNDKIRSGSKTFTRKKYKVLQCDNCSLVFLEKKRKNLENSALTRKLYNKDNSIKEFLNFHTPRELKKLKFIEKKINLINKKVLESNCGAGVLLNKLKKKSKITAGVDSIIYKEHLEKNGHLFFKNFEKIKKDNIKFDLIFSLSEIEHKYNPIKFLNNLKKILKNNGYLVLRVPNFYNIYMYLNQKSFFKYDYRTSHNYYFSKKNLDMLFENLKLKVMYKSGFNEYSANHLLSYSKKRSRVRENEVIKYLKENHDRFLIKNIEDTFVSTSLIYILKKIY